MWRSGWKFHLIAALVIGLCVTVFVSKGHWQKLKAVLAEKQKAEQVEPFATEAAGDLAAEPTPEFPGLVPDDVQHELLIALGYFNGPSEIVSLDGLDLLRVRKALDRALADDPDLQSFRLSGYAVLEGLSGGRWQMSLRFSDGAEVITRAGDIYRFVDGGWQVVFPGRGRRGPKASSSEATRPPSPAAGGGQE